MSDFPDLPDLGRCRLAIAAHATLVAIGIISDESIVFAALHQQIVRSFPREMVDSVLEDLSNADDGVLAPWMRTEDDLLSLISDPRTSGDIISVEQFLEEQDDG